jgi:hypothetical protein
MHPFGAAAGGGLASSHALVPPWQCAAAAQPRRAADRVGGDRLVFWKAKSEEVDGESYGPVWIADANDPDVTLEEHDEWLTWGQAEEFARKRAFPLEDV